jgi:hypothetical protein
MNFLKVCFKHNSYHYFEIDQKKLFLQLVDEQVVVVVAVVEEEEEEQLVEWRVF